MKRYVFVVFGFILVGCGLLWFFFSSLSRISISPTLFVDALRASKKYARTPDKSIGFGTLKAPYNDYFFDVGLFPAVILQVDDSHASDGEYRLTVLHAQTSRNLIFTISYYPCLFSGDVPKPSKDTYYNLGLTGFLQSLDSSTIHTKFPMYEKSCSKETIDLLTRHTPTTAEMVRSTFSANSSPGFPSINFGSYQVVNTTNSLFSFFVKEQRL